MKLKTMELKLSPQSRNGNGTVKNWTGTLMVDVFNVAGSKASSSKSGEIRDFARSNILNSRSLFPWRYWMVKGQEITLKK